MNNLKPCLFAGFLFMSINNCMRDLLLERIYQQVPEDVYE